MLGMVLEGGANRTFYSIGVLDAFLDKGIACDFFVGVSAGLANGVSYISRQKGRSLELGLRYMNDKRYMGARYFFKKENHSYYNRSFVFDEIPNKYLPFDYKTYNEHSGGVYAVVTNLETGKAEYLPVRGADKKWTVIQASCALPFMFRPMEIDGNLYMDGGCSDPLPIKFAFDKGCDKVISIITRERGYEKRTEADVKFSVMLYRKKQAFANDLINRSSVYNASKRYLFEKEKEGKAFVFAPRDTSGWKRTESSTDALQKMYDEGYNDVLLRLDELKEFIG